MIGFDSLTDAGCLRVLGKYDEGLAKFERGEVNYPCGSSARTVRRWRRELSEEIARRDIQAAA